MRFSSFIYLVGQGLHNLRANRLMTFASMGVLTVCMLLIGAASLLGVNIDHMVEYIGNQNLTVVYMGGTGESEVATDEQIAAADAAIRNTPHVVSVTYMSPEDVLATYSDMLKDYTNLQQVFANDNPFTPNYRVTVDDPDNIKEVSAQLMQIDGVYSVKAPLAMADTFTSLQKVINYACYGLVAVLAIVSIVVINNTIKITVFNRRKEIGILRAIGASKHNVSQVFNAETFIIGLCSGVMGVVLCLVLLIPGNMLIHHLAGNANVVAALPPLGALILIVLATLLTMLGGLIPARSAAKSNPVKALRSE